MLKKKISMKWCFFSTELKVGMEREKYPEYLDEFEEGVKDDVLMINQISLEDIQEEEKHLRDEHVQWVSLWI